MYRHIIEDDGLCSNVVYYVFQDQEKNMWFATDKGVIRYNGVSYTRFHKGNGLSDNEVLQIHEDHKGRIWFLTINGLPSFFYSDQIYQSSNSSLLKGFKGGSFLYGFTEDYNGNIWIGSKSDGAYKLSMSGELEQVSANSEYNRIFSFHHKDSIIHAIGSDGLYVVSSGNQLKRLSKELKKIPSPRSVFHKEHYYIANGSSIVVLDGQGIKIKENKILEKNEIIFIGVKNEHELWLGTRKGYFSYNINDGSISKGDLINEGITCIATDHEGGLWLSTINNGVYYTFSHEIELYDKRCGLPMNKTINVFSLNNKVITCFDNGQVAEINDNSINVKEVPYFNGNGKILHITQIEEEVFVGTENFLMQINGVDTSYYQILSRNVLDKNGKLYICGYKGLSMMNREELNQFKCEPPNFLTDISSTYDETLIFSGATRVIYDVGDDGLLLGHDKGLSLIKDDKTTYLLEGVRVMDIVSGINGLWVGTYGKGLFFYGEKDTLNILTDKYCNKLINDGGNIWVATSTGLFAVKGIAPDFEVSSFQHSYLLPDDLINGVARDSLDNIWVATQKGIVKINHNINYIDLPNRQVYVDSVYAGDEYFKETDTVRLSYSNNSLRITFKFTSFYTPFAFEYDFSSGDISNWKKGVGHQLILDDLLPGNYMLKVKSRDEVGSLKGNIDKLFIIVESPFWYSWWFRLSIILLTSSLIFLFFKIRVFVKNRDLIRNILLIVQSKLQKEKSIIIKTTEGKYVKVVEGDLLWIKASNVYVEIMTKKRSFLVRSKLSTIEKQLGHMEHVIRVHRSYLANLTQFDALSTDLSHLMYADEEIPVSRTYRNDVKKYKAV